MEIIQSTIVEIEQFVVGHVQIEMSATGELFLTLLYSTFSLLAMCIPIQWLD